MADVVERVRALIARTSSPHEEEARTAAMIACRLIREHRLDVVPPGPAPSIGHEDFSAAWSERERERRARGRSATGRGGARAPGGIRRLGRAAAPRARAPVSARG